MKQIKFLLVGVGLICALSFAPRWAAAASSPFYVTASTVTPNASTSAPAVFTGAGFPNKTGNLYIRQINLDNFSTMERVTIWNNCTSSTAVTAIWSGVVESSKSLIVPVAPRLMPVANPCVTRGTTNTDNTSIKASIHYE